MAASYAIANCVPEDELSTENILPNAFDRSVANAVAEAVAEAGIKSGVAKIK